MITLDGVNPQKKWGLRPLVGQLHPATPEVKTNTVEIPGMPGAWDFGSNWGTRSFNIPFGKIEKNRYERQRILREFVAFLLDSYGKPREIKLVYLYEPDKYYTVKLSSQFDPDRSSVADQFTLPMIATDPIAKFVAPTTDITMGSDVVPIWSDVYWGTGGAEYQISKPQTITMMNSGNQAIRMSVLIRGSGTNVKLSANGTTMDLGTFPNSIINIQGDDWNIFINRVEELVTPYFIELLPGENKVSIKGSDLNFTITENMTYQYV